jgi:hypothetical protein
MASIRIERQVHAPADRVWDAVRDIGALHTRLVPGFVVDVRLENGARIVTFGDGRVAHELIVDLDDARRRFAYSVRADGFIHHSATNEVVDPGDGTCRFVWVADVLPDAVAGLVERMMSQGADVLKTTLESADA